MGPHEGIHRNQTVYHDGRDELPDICQPHAPAHCRKDGIFHACSIPDYLVWQVRCPIRKAFSALLTVSFLGRAHGFSGLVRTLKRMLLLFFYDLASKDQIFDAPLSLHDCPASSSPGTTHRGQLALQPITYVGSLSRYRYRPRYLAVLGERR
jgi:hypothetical protein